MLLDFHTDTPPQSPTTMTLIGPPVRTARKLTSSCVCNNVITTMDAQQKGITLSQSLSLCLSSSGHCYDHKRLYKGAAVGEGLVQSFTSAATFQENRVHLYNMSVPNGEQEKGTRNTNR